MGVYVGHRIDLHVVNIGMVQLKVNQQFGCEQAKDAKKDDQDQRRRDTYKDVQSVDVR